MDHQEEQFTRGFNSGYLLAKYLPELKSKINKSLTGGSDYSKGFLFGAREYEFERGSELERVRNKSKNKDRTIGKNI